MSVTAWATQWDLSKDKNKKTLTSKSQADELKMKKLGLLERSQKIMGGAKRASKPQVEKHHMRRHLFGRRQQHSVLVCSQAKAQGQPPSDLNLEYKKAEF